MTRGKKKMRCVNMRNDRLGKPAELTTPQWCISAPETVTGVLCGFTRHPLMSYNGTESVTTLLIPRLKTSPAFLVCLMSATLTVLLLELDAIKSYQWQRTFSLQYYDTVKSGAAPELWKAGIWRNSLYLCLGKPEPSPRNDSFFSIHSWG